MALQVWLPLTKDLRNQGLDNNYLVSTSTATYSSAGGKLGGCYNFSGTTGTGILLSGDVATFMNTYINNHSWSMCAWVKNSVSDRSTPVISLTYGLRMTAGATTGVSLYNSSRTVSCTSNVTTGDGKWHHIVATYDVNTNAIKIYVDGINTGNATYTSGYTYASSWTNGLFIGRDPNNNTANASYFYQGAMNDIRIYDHCLSLMEVKQLSQGLILHYPLNRQGFGQENLFSQKYWTYSTSGWAGNVISSVAGSTIKPIINSDGSCILTGAGSSGNSQCYLQNSSHKVNLTANKTYTISVLVTSTNVSKFKFWWYDYDSNGNRLTTSSTNIFTINHGETKLLSYTRTLSENTTSCYWELNMYTADTSATLLLHAHSLKLEEGSIATPWCPNSADELATTMGLNGTTEYDTSGYCNNGTWHGTHTNTSDTPKYAVSTTATGNASTYLEGPILPAEAQTAALWIKSKKSQNAAIFNDKTTGLQIGLLNSLLYMNSKASTAGFTTTHWIDDDWNHVVVTYDGTTRKVYINGEAETQSGASNYYIHNADNCWLWNRSYNNNYPFNGSLSDFRIYATALSADDVKSLYQNCATIDSDGTIHGKIR